MFSPGTEVNENKETRQNIVQGLMPELERSYKGDSIHLSAYPNLKSVVQTGHKNIRGIITFKDALVYAQPQFSCFSLPQNNASTQLYECYRNGKRVSEFTNGQIAEQS
jgi:hypothetical protein